MEKSLSEAVIDGINEQSLFPDMTIRSTNPEKTGEFTLIIGLVSDPNRKEYKGISPSVSKAMSLLKKGSRRKAFDLLARTGLKRVSSKGMSREQIAIGKAGMEKIRQKIKELEKKDKENK